MLDGEFYKCHAVVVDFCRFAIISDDMTDPNCLNKKVIMVIDEEPEVVGSYKEFLEVEGFQVEMITSGKVAMLRMEGMVRGEEDISSLIVLDLLLPDISGLAILEAIRKQPVFDNTFVVIFTNYRSDTFKESTEKMPKVRYLSKADTSPADLTTIVKANT